MRAGLMNWHRVVWLLVFVVPLAAPPGQAGALTGKIQILRQLPAPRADYPIPTDDDVLFYLQRSTISNTVVYAAKRDAKGDLDPNDPIEVYWRRFDTTGERRPLKFVEKMFAFGVVAEPAETGNHTFLANLVSYPNRRAVIGLDGQGKPQAILKVGDRDARLVYAYLEVDSDGWIPGVKYVDLFAIDINNGNVLWERIRP